jgi:hypothetical protein
LMGQKCKMEYYVLVTYLTPSVHKKMCKFDLNFNICLYTELCLDTF